MAVGMLMAIPELDSGTYDQIMAAMDWDTAPPPDGLIAHYAGAGPDGWTVYDVWESKEDFQRFAESRLGAAMQQVTGQSPEIAPTFIPIHNAFTAVAATV